MTAITRLEEIEAWQGGRYLTNVVDALTIKPRFRRDFGLRDQMRRAAVSVISNIAEGFESRTDTQFINFLGIARGSAGEVRAQLYIAFDQKYLDKQQFKELIALAEKYSRQIAKFIMYLENNPRPRRVSEDIPSYDL